MTAFQRLYDKAFPPICVFCGEQGAFVCTGCEQDVPRNAPACRCCAAPLTIESECGACLVRTPAFDEAIVPWRYAFPLDEAIRQFKFHARLHYVPALLQLLDRTIAELPAGIDRIQAVPLHWRRRTSRGFNQAEEIARPLAARLGLRFKDSVRRRTPSVPQSTLSRKDRQRNLKQHFAARHALPPEHVLVVDDVMTTGATVDAISRCLKNAGARRVTVLAIARS